MHLPSFFVFSIIIVNRPMVISLYLDVIFGLHNPVKGLLLYINILLVYDERRKTSDIQGIGKELP